ncbi:MAG: mandelate racemase/muconate lactonizing enzyme family protein [Solirubrobacteraceae bacterium]
MQLSVCRHTLRLRAPLLTAFGAIERRVVLSVSLRDEDGALGYGEAAPLAAYDGVSVERVEQALERYRPVLAASAGLNGAEIVDACRRADDLPEAFAAIDLALWDRAGRRAGKPVAALITDAPATAVAVNATISALDRASASEGAAAAAAGGFACLKLKVGSGDDAGRLAAVRAAAGAQMEIRLDANGAWTVEQAVRNIEALAPAGLELVEEPVHGLAGVRAVRERVATRVAIDETAAEHGALTAGVADAVCLKVSRCGGISGLLAAAALVRASGAEAYVASTLDGPLGVAAGVHAAGALASRGPLPACGLATLGMFESIDDDLLAPRNGQIVLPSGPGLGVEPLPVSGAL